MADDNIRARTELRKNIRHPATPKSKRTIDNDRVAKLVRMLASDRDGEVLAAARR